MKKLISMRTLCATAVAAIATSNIFLASCNGEEDYEMNGEYTLARQKMTRSPEGGSPEQTCVITKLDSTYAFSATLSNTRAEGFTAIGFIQFEETKTGYKAHLCSYTAPNLCSVDAVYLVSDYFQYRYRLSFSGKNTDGINVNGTSEPIIFSVVTENDSTEHVLP